MKPKAGEPTKAPLSEALLDAIASIHAPICPGVAPHGLSALTPGAYAESSTSRSSDTNEG